VLRLGSYEPLPRRARPPMARTLLVDAANTLRGLHRYPPFRFWSGDQSSINIIFTMEKLGFPSELSSRPKTSLPVTGSLANEILSGPRIVRGGLPVRFAKRQRRSSAGSGVCELLRTGKRGRSDKTPVCNVGFTLRNCCCLGQPEVNHFDGELRPLNKHQVSRLKISMNQAVRFQSNECPCGLRNNFQSQRGRQRSAFSQAGFQCFALDQFHRVKALTITLACPVVKD
jgi:hypothetical protein